MEAEPTKADPPLRKRRWFQFSLRTLLIFVVVCAIPCAWIGSKIARKRGQRAAVDAIRNLGGDVYYDESGAPAWLRRLFGDDLFGEVDGVALVGNSSADDQLVNIKHFHRLTWLILNGSNVTDAGLAQLAGLTQLKDLRLYATPITDAGVANLKRLPQLNFLEVSRTQVTGAGVADLQKALPNCKIIH